MRKRRAAAASCSLPAETTIMLHPATWCHFGSLANGKIGFQWTVLAVLSVIFVLLLELLKLPATLLLGTMCAAIVVAAAGDCALRVPNRPFLLAQGVVGCLIARSITPPIIGTILHNWPLLLAMVIAVIAVSNLLGWVLARRGVLPGTTAIWGSAPGAATAMTLVAEAYGADIRLVAFMQYLRIVFVSIAASIISKIWAPASDVQASGVLWSTPILWIPFFETLALAGLGTVVTRFLRIPAGPLLLPLAIGAVLHGSGLMVIELPPWLLAASYTIIGWSIGLRFTRAIIIHVAHALPRVAISTLTLIAICGGLGFCLTCMAGVDPLTAYLATSPGGADAVAIIAASANVNVPFVMALQTARFMIVLIVGPGVARFIARRTETAEEHA